MRCLQHLSKPRNCQNIPADIWKEAGQLIMQKGGIEVIALSDDDDKGTSTSTLGVAVRKGAKGASGQVIAMKRTMDAFLNRAMSTDEVDMSVKVCVLIQTSLDSLILKFPRFFVHTNIAFSAAGNPFFLKWLYGLRPSYSAPSCYVLMERYLPAEEQHAVVEDM
jgi:hypothetical protein